MEHPQIRGLSSWRPLAHGGLADLWEARQDSLDRCVAVKVYGPSQDLADQGFLREVAAAGRLSSHPGVVTVYDAGILPDDRLFLIMEHCPGRSLIHRLDPRSRLGDERVRRIGVHIADALAAAHSVGILHRSVQPATILLDSFDNARLADFSSAVVAGAEPPGADLPPAPSDYAPPEASAGPATEAGDVFSLAATLWALLTGAVPRPLGAGSRADGTAAGHGNGAPTTADPSLVGALTKGLAIDPAARPTAAQLRDQLLDRARDRESTSPSTGDRVDIVPTAATVRAPSPPSRNASDVVPSAAAVARGASDPVSTTTRPRWVRRRTGIPLLAVTAFAVLASAGVWLISDYATGSAPLSTPRATTGSSRALAPASPASAQPGPDGTGIGSSPSSATKVIEMDRPSLTTKPFEVVQIRGTYTGGADTFVHAQRREGGRWVSFPLPAKTDQSGRFTLYVELGTPGRYQLRTVDPESGLSSEVFVLRVAE